MLRLISVVAAVLLLVPQGHAEEAVWLTNWSEAFRVAKRERKLVFVDYRADWCAPCRMMEQNVFPTAAVQERLREYVLLRIDVDKDPTPPSRRVKRILPTYIVYDAQERERFQFHGGMPAAAFVTRLDGLRAAMPFLLTAADLFAQKKELAAWTQLAKGYTKLGAAEQAREAWHRVERAARSDGDRETSQDAAINGAFTWTMQGQTAKAVELLQQIAAKPVNRETEALSWFVLGQAYVKAKDTARGREAFEKAKSLLAADHAVAREAAAALAALQ